MIWIYLLIVNAATFLVYAYDKSIAGRQIRRVPEGFLHTCSALGGSLGALLAMQLVRHKTKKVKFQITFWLIVFVQVVAAGYWVSVRSHS